MPRSVETEIATFRVPDDVVPPPLIGDQHVVLLNIAHERMSPISDKPAVRIMGLFQTEEEARSMVPDNAPISYYVCPTHKFLPLISGLDVSPEPIVQDIVKLHTALLDANEIDFQDTVKEQRQGKTGNSVNSIRARSMRTRATRAVDLPEVPKIIAPLTANACLVGQNFAVVTVLTDIRPFSLSGEAPLEPLIAVLHASGSQEDARNYAKYTASKAYPKNNILVVDMYEWLHLEHADLKQITEECPNPTLDAIKKRRRVVKQQVEELKKIPGSVIELDIRPPSDKVVDDKAADKAPEKAVDEKPHDEKDEKALDEKKAPPDECLQLVEDISQEFKNM